MLPDDIIQRIVLFCESENLGLAQIGSNKEKIHILMIGSKDYSPDQVAILCASMLLEGVITGGFIDINNDALQKQKGDKNIKPN